MALVLVGLLARRLRAFALGLCFLTLADGLILARHRPFDLGSSRPLIEQSPVLARLAREPRGLRTLDPGQNLFMIAGVAPVAAYRTLDLPAPGALLQLGRGPLTDPRVLDAWRIAGVGLRVLDPLEARSLPAKALEGWPGEVETIRDPSLAGWIFGVDFAESSGLRDFTLLRPKDPPHRAWLIPSNGLEGADGMADPLLLLDKFRGAAPLESRSEVPERVEVEVEVTGSTPSMVVLSTTFDPGWRAWWVAPSGGRRPAGVVKVLGGWQGVQAPEPGRWTLHLEYPGQDARVGLAVASAAWVVWALAYLRLGLGRSSCGPEVLEIGPEGGS